MRNLPTPNSPRAAATGEAHDLYCHGVDDAENHLGENGRWAQASTEDLGDPLLMPCKKANRDSKHDHPGKTGDENNALPSLAQHNVALTRFLCGKHDRFITIFRHAKSP
ncbi:MAG: hypothetical protein ABSC72_10645 [Methylovirgula sp.]